MGADLGLLCAKTEGGKSQALATCKELSHMHLGANTPVALILGDYDQAQDVLSEFVLRLCLLCNGILQHTRTAFMRAVQQNRIHVPKTSFAVIKRQPSYHIRTGIFSSIVLPPATNCHQRVSQAGGQPDCQCNCQISPVMLKCFKTKNRKIRHQRLREAAAG